MCLGKPSTFETINEFDDLPILPFDLVSPWLFVAMGAFGCPHPIVLMMHKEACHVIEMISAMFCRQCTRVKTRLWPWWPPLSSSFSSTHFSWGFLSCCPSMPMISPPCPVPTWDHIKWWCPEFWCNEISQTPLIMRITCWWKCRLVQPLWKTAWNFLRK